MSTQASNEPHPVDPSLWQVFQRRPLTVEQTRAVDRIAIEQYGMDSLVLMENAALGCVQWIVERYEVPVTTVILCGNGNNGGDGRILWF